MDSSGHPGTTSPGRLGLMGLELKVRSYSASGRLPKLRTARRERYESPTAQLRHPMAGQSVLQHSSVYSFCQFYQIRYLIILPALSADHAARHLVSRRHLTSRRLWPGRCPTARTTRSGGRDSYHARREWRGESQFGRVWLVPRDHRMRPKRLDDASDTGAPGLMFGPTITSSSPVHVRRIVRYPCAALPLRHTTRLPGTFVWHAGYGHAAQIGHWARFAARGTDKQEPTDDRRKCPSFSTVVMILRYRTRTH